MGKKEKSKDPWHVSNIEDTLGKRKDDRRNLVNVIDAMDAQLKHEVTQILGKHTKGEGPPDWSLIDSQSKKYNKAVADEVIRKIDEVYSLDSELHPLAGIIKKAGLERNYFNEQLVKGLYFRHTEALKKSVGAKDYMRLMTALHDDNLEKVTKDMGEHMLADVDAEKHGDYVLDFIKDKYRFDSKKVNPDLMKRDAREILANHINGKIDKDSIHRQYKASKKK